MENNKLSDDTINKLFSSARAARSNAYAPYSRFGVGCALLAASGKIYTGCNIENSSYPVGICAERTALAKAVSEGEKDFLAMAILGSNDGESCLPCGMCRQFISELCSPHFKIFTENNGKTEMHSLNSLFPKPFLL